MRHTIHQWPLTREEEGQLLINERFTNLTQGIKLTTQELQELSQILMLKVIYCQASVPMGALTLMVLQDLRKKIYQRFTRLHFSGKRVGSLSLTLAQWAALRDLLLYSDYDSLLLRSALGKIDSSVNPPPQIHANDY